MDAIDLIADPQARLIAESLYRLSNGEALPAYESPEWNRLKGAVDDLLLAPTGWPQAQIGIAAIAMLVMHMLQATIVHHLVAPPAAPGSSANEGAATHE